jgi:hypothetical protein
VVGGGQKFSTIGSISVNTTLEDQSQSVRDLAANPSTPGLYGIAPNYLLGTIS